jgi:hypothetical protein
MLRFHTPVVDYDDTVGQDAIDIDSQELDRRASGGQIGR